MPHVSPHHSGCRSLAAAVLAALCGCIAGCGGGAADAASAGAQEVAAGKATQAVPAALPAPASASLALRTSADESAVDLGLPGGAALTGSTTEQRALELAYLGAALAPDLLEFARLEVPGVEHLQALKDGQGSFLGLRTSFGQAQVNNGVRAEVSVNYPYREGETVRYSWKFAIARGFRSDAPTNRWWLFGDWHVQPDPRLGETWASYPRVTSPVGLGYGQIDGQDYLALIYGAPDSTTVGLIPFGRDLWHQIDVEITWSRGQSGRAAVYLGGSATPAHTAQGPNMQNGYQHYLKLGSYREPNIPGDAWVYVRDVKIQRLGL